MLGLPLICGPLKIYSVERPLGGQPKSNACGDMSRAVRRLAQEPTEAVPQNHRDAVGILFTLGRGGCQEQERCPREPGCTLNWCSWFHSSRVVRPPSATTCGR